MKAERPYPAYTVTPKAEAAILKGHPWVYADEITAAPAQPPENGAVVDVLSSRGRYLGSGLLSEASKIRVRLLGRNANDRYDEAFWRRRIEYAWAYRKAIYPAEDLQCCRVVFGEADGLPGLTVDRFGPILSVQILSYGMDRRKELLARLLAETLAADGEVIEGVFLRNDAALREKEGLSEGKGWLEVPGLVHPEKAETIITENGVRYHVDVENGQKTGFFLDQKLNRRRVAQLAKGRRVLDCFTHTGSFALNAAFGGAGHVTAVDVSEAAVEMARANAVLNGLEGRMDFVCADVFDLLPGLEGKCDYDFIILDPPAFTKSRKTAANAMRGYKEINYRAMKLLPRGGILATASCSHFATPVMFEAMLADAARDAGRQLRQIEARQQAPDHPILWNVEETNYLKFYLFQVV
ncbi:class I SAM-dependent rRNA methyltransferase [Candidatus Allofournierella merdipullorum]|uniref:class I SAM-dependent rRNA methyltransferase n=1 Tax=Candidatus Allofournierella merdipullorum TaxID=2838595 RepID=UPI002A885556|nr:class I SAM-dependent rRNA methyltransferase [Candidatus Fournierella merdipullorum]